MKFFFGLSVCSFLALFFAFCLNSTEKSKTTGCCCNPMMNCCDTTVFNNCPDEGKKPVKLNFDSLLYSIDNEIEHFVKMSEMPQSKSFKYLYDHPNLYRGDVIRCISDTTKILKYKVWAVESQCSCDDTYYSFCKIAFQLFKEKKIEERLMAEIIDPAVNYHLPFVRQVGNKRFKDLLDDLSKHPSAEGLRYYIKTVQSGYVCKNIQKYR
jgi:hypothetical protein